MLKRIYAGIAVLIRRPVVGDTVKRAFSTANKAVYRASRGRLWNRFRQGEIILLTTTGRRSGRNRRCPLVTVRTDAGYAVIGSNAGGPTHPAWVHNLRANPHADLTIGTRHLPVTAREVLDAAEWDRLFALFVLAHDGYADYVTKTSRHLPIFTLDPATGPAVHGRHWRLG